MKKKVKKVTKKRKSRRKARVDPQKLLLAKIDRIKDRVPRIEPTGECIDKITGEVLFRFTEAQHVFKVYREQCEMENLAWRPYADSAIQPKAIAVGNMPMLIGFFCIEDLETGARLVGWGSGMGANRDWSANTAGTRALKQFLLTTFEATWEDPENPILDKERLKAQVIRELEASGTLAQIEQIKFWAEQFGKKKGKDDANSKGKNTKDRRRTSDKKNRKRAKRDHR